MSIFTTNLKRLFKSKIQLFFIIIFPLSIMSLAFIQNGFELRVAVVDKDQTELTRSLINELESKVKVTSVKEAEIKKELLKLNVDYVLVINQDFTKALISGNVSQLNGYSIKETNISEPIKAYVNSFVYNMKQLAQASNHQSSDFYKALETYKTARINITEQSTLGENWTKTRAALGYMTLAMLYTSAVTAMLIIMNRNNGTLYRTLMAPVSIKNYMLQNIASFIVVSILQIVILFVILVYGFDLYLGKSVLSMVILFTLFALVCVSLGITISSFSKTVVQAGIITICIVPPIAMLGGSYWPIDQVPDSLKAIAPFVPVTWVMDGAEKLLKDQSFSEISQNFIVLLLFAVIFFLLGTIRKVDIASK